MGANNSNEDDTTFLFENMQNLNLDASMPIEKYDTFRIKKIELMLKYLEQCERLFRGHGIIYKTAVRAHYPDAEVNYREEKILVRKTLRDANQYRRQIRNLRNVLIYLIEFYGKKQKTPPNISIQKINQDKDRLAGIVFTLTHQKPKVLGKGFETTVKQPPQLSFANKATKKVMTTPNIEQIKNFIELSKQFEKEINSRHDKLRMLPQEIKVYPELGKIYPGMDPKFIKVDKDGRKEYIGPRNVYIIQELVRPDTILTKVIRDNADDKVIQIYLLMLKIQISVLITNIGSEWEIALENTTNNFAFSGGMIWFLDTQTPMVRKKGEDSKKFYQVWKEVQRGRMMKFNPLQLGYFENIFEPTYSIRRLANFFFYARKKPSQEYKNAIFEMTKEVVNGSRFSNEVQANVLKKFKIGRVYKI